MHFETIGNATVICYEDRPILATDPWIQGSAYFGSWKLSHQIPRAQLDDLLIGNFMKTTLVGKWPGSWLHPFFTPIVAKYADNGGAYTAQDLEAYFHSYRARDPLEFIVHRFQQRSVQTFRNFVAPQSRVFDYGKRAYFFIKKMI